VRWLNSWKDYTGYEQLIKGIQYVKVGEDPQKSKNFRKKRPGRINTDLLKNENKYIKIPEELAEFEFLNAVFETDNEKDKDYITVDSEVFTFLHEKYGGNVIQRPLRHMKGSNAYVDVAMHDCYFCFVGPKNIENIKAAT
jgi:hypothetical protein